MNTTNPTQSGNPRAMADAVLADPVVQPSLRDPQTRNITININHGSDYPNSRGEHEYGQRARFERGHRDRYGERQGGLLGRGREGRFGQRHGQQGGYYDEEYDYKGQERYEENQGGLLVRGRRDDYGGRRGGLLGRGRGGGLLGRGGNEGDRPRRGLPVIGLLQQGISSVMKSASDKKEAHGVQDKSQDVTGQSSGYADAAPPGYEDVMHTEKRLS